MFELESDFKFVRLVFFSYFDVSLKKKKKADGNFWPTLYNALHLTEKKIVSAGD